MAGNLKPLTTEKAREIGSKGGKRSAEVKRQRKAMREQMECLLSLPIKDKKITAKFKQLGLKADDMNNQMALIVATYQKALKGDMQAMNVVRELVGERVQEFKVSANIDDKVKELHGILDEMKNEQTDN
ncbi:MAG: KGG domain-containing protein [Erysipelotrichia bacterium]|nr:KGG domain-containing protein [Erysipelotrichia bacterium]